MHRITAPTMTELHDSLCSRLLYSTRENVDYITGMDVVLEHVFAEAQSMVWDYNLKRIWVPPSRWTKMIREYVDPEEVQEWLQLIENRHQKKAAQRFVLRTKKVASKKGGKTTVRNLGSCMLSLSVALQPEPVATLHSRTCYLGYLSPLDMSIAYHLTRLAADVMGVPLESFRFAWFLETAQFHQFRTIAFALGDDRQRQRFLEAPVTPENVAHARALKHYRKWRSQDDSGTSYDDMQRFVSYRRLRKRFHTEVMGYDYAQQFEGPESKAFKPLPSQPVTSLTFEKIGLE